MRPSVLLSIVPFAAACGGSSPPPQQQTGDTGGGEMVENDPRVSTSAGEDGGLVILWPRIVGFPEREPATLQSKLREIAASALPDAPVDVRPDPERACPRAGCNGVSVGSLLVQQNESCIVVVLISEAGQSPTHLLPVMGRVDLRANEIPFREPAESFVTAHDFAPCSEIEAKLDEHRAEIVAAIEDAD